MKFTLIICTYKRAKPLVTLLNSIKNQTLYPSEILIIDGSPDDLSEKALQAENFQNLSYFRVPLEDRGLTRQRNFGIERVASDSEIVCFLDDDTELFPDYFEELIKTYDDHPDIFGVGGIAVNENRWKQADPNIKYNNHKYFKFENFVIKEGQRNVARNYLGLQSHLGPGKMPNYSHGRTCGFPMNDKIYEVDLLIGMSFSFRKKVFEQLRFSPYFEGYGLYEDADFSVRALQFGKNVINTKVKLNHYHNPAGRPNKYQYGKMVVRNGWYVWRVKNPNPNFKDRLKWNSISFLLTLIRFSNTFTSGEKKEALTEAIGRTAGWMSLFFNKPKQK